MSLCVLRWLDVHSTTVKAGLRLEYRVSAHLLAFAQALTSKGLIGFVVNFSSWHAGRKKAGTFKPRILVEFPPRPFLRPACWISWIGP